MPRQLVFHIAADCYRYLCAGAASRVKWVQAGRLRGCWLSAQPDLRSVWPSVSAILLSSPLSNESGESVFDVLERDRK
jgi:hypothetical protein